MRQNRLGYVAALAEVRRFPVGVLLGALVLLIVVSPFLDDWSNAMWVEPVLMTFILISAVFAVGARWRTLLALCVLAIPALVGRWVNHLWPDLMPPEVFLLAGILFMAFVIALLLRFILRAARVDSEVLCVGVVIFLMLGLVWALAYLFVSRASSNAFGFSTDPPGTSMDSFNALYFSFGTLSTVGFGDIVPKSRVARMLAVMEATTGMIYLAIIVARLVSMYSSPAAAPDEPAAQA
jgi:hypothetical protein